MSDGTVEQVRTAYESFLWRTMELLGVSESIERKVVVAVAIQFLVSTAQVLLPVFVSGVVWYALAGALFLAALIAFVNTLLITRRDFVDPITTLEEQANAVAAGDVNVALERSDQPDEIGSLTNAFVEMGDYLRVVSDQAAALARQEFDDPALDKEVPGTFGHSLRQMATSLEEYTEELELMTDRLEERSERLEALVEEFGLAAERARDGDLTATIDEETVADEDDERLRDVVKNYNDLVGTLAKTVGEGQEFAKHVADASDEVTTSMVEVDEASDEVARSIQEISAGAADQTEDLQQVASEMNTLSATVEEIAASADKAAETAASAAERGRTGREAATEAIAELDELKTRINATADAVEELVGRIDEIDEIVSFIDDVAEQTNMLALNASIEAARADGKGDGFAVVADEIKMLSEETRESAEEISKRIEGIQTDSAETVEDVHAMEQQVTRSASTIETTLSDFEEIVDVVNDVNSTVQEINSATDDQAHTTQEVVEMVNEVASISEETTAKAESVAAAAQQQTAAISEVNDDVRQLSGEADDLQKQLETFTVDRSGRQSTRSATVSVAQGDD